MALKDYAVLTFDCYGTLIDWETGIERALTPWLARHGRPYDRARAMDAFGRHESAQQAETPGMLYPELLAAVHARIAADWGLPADPDDARAFGASVRDWPPFADSPDALAYLKRHYKLVILSNVDRQSFSHSNARLGVDFDAVYTAQDIGTYKPDPRNFDYLIAHVADDLGLGRERILHTAQSLFHDHQQARRHGLATCWIDRGSSERDGGAARVPQEAIPVDFRFPTLAAMCEAHRAEGAG
ncbi:MAG: haloacid dehalogenase type II [Rhodospirillaceae bacterium]|nr:haloacid dehalogenase type II [Rhodospirillaceae bacterium]